MVIRTAFNQLHHSTSLLALSVIGMIFTYADPLAVLIIGAIGSKILLIATAGVAWDIMILCYVPTLKLYARNPIEALLLPLTALLYTLMTLDSARHFWCNKNPTWKGRVNQTGSSRIAARRVASPERIAARRASHRKQENVCR